MSTRTRSWACARTPQVVQPMTSVVVSTVITTSAGLSSTASTRKPSNPNSASARPLASFIVRGSSSLGRLANLNDGGTLTALVDLSLRHAPQFNARSHYDCRRAYG
jgi:hypothetical protein